VIDISLFMNPERELIMLTSITFMFLQTRLLMEAVAEYAGDIHSQVANGLAEIQEILFEVERVEELLNTGTIAVDPAAFQLVLATAMRVSSINVRHRVEAGETGLQETLDEVEQLERSLLRDKGIDADHSEIGESS